MTKRTEIEGVYGGELSVSSCPTPHGELAEVKVVGEDGWTGVVVLDEKGSMLLANTLGQIFHGKDPHVDLDVPETYSEDAMFEAIYGED